MSNRNCANWIDEKFSWPTLWKVHWIQRKEGTFESTDNFAYVKQTKRNRSPWLVTGSAKSIILTFGKNVMLGCCQLCAGNRKIWLTIVDKTKLTFSKIFLDWDWKMSVWSNILRYNWSRNNLKVDKKVKWKYNAFGNNQIRGSGWHGG